MHSRSYCRLGTINFICIVLYCMRSSWSDSPIIRVFGEVRFTPPVLTTATGRWAFTHHLRDESCCLCLDVVFDDVVDELVLVLRLHHPRAAGTSVLHRLLNVNLTFQAWTPSPHHITPHRSRLTPLHGSHHADALDSCAPSIFIICPIAIGPDATTPAHQALEQVVATKAGHCPGTNWRRPPGRFRRTWIQQVGEGTPASWRQMWQSAEERGHRGESSQRTTAVYASWWWWWFL